MKVDTHLSGRVNSNLKRSGYALAIPVPGSSGQGDEDRTPGSWGAPPNPQLSLREGNALLELCVQPRCMGLHCRGQA